MEKDELAITIVLLTAVALGVTWVVVDEMRPHTTGQDREQQMVQKTESATPVPVAPRRPHRTTHHSIEMVDDYHWLEDESYPRVDDEDVLDYLRRENDYYESTMGAHQPLIDSLYEELVARIEKDESSVPVPDGPFEYFWRYDEGAQYRSWYRRPVEGGEDELLLDETRRAGDRGFYRLGGFAVSEDHGHLAFSEDTSGSERFTMRVKDLRTGRILDDRIPETLGDPVWDSASKGFVYVKLDDRWRPFQARYHELGTDVARDPVIYTEDDPGFFVDLGRTQSRRYILVTTGDNITTEVRVLDASDVTSSPVLIAPRRSGHEYHVDHGGDWFYIRTNDEHPNFRIVRVGEDDPAPENWEQIMAPSDATYYTGLAAFARFLVIEERTKAQDGIRVRPHSGEDGHMVAFDEEVFAVSLGDTREYDVDTFRIEYESMVTPRTVMDYRVKDRSLITRKVQKIPSGYDPSLYESVRLWATARDSTRVPVTVLYRKDFKKDGKGFLHLYGYGAYGYGIPPRFSTSRLSLVDRGFAYAIAHVRGGDEMGRRWYEQGRLFERTNAFTDFVDAARFLVEEGWSCRGRISISGGSAGGSLVGYVVNSDPDLWGAAVAHVPFVDILNTMLDEDLPLTPIEWPIWGNPVEDPEAFRYIASYSPYDNVRAQDYPPMLVTAGLNDPRVTYWEPAKWVARLRATKTGDDLLLLKTNMGAGHQGKSGRFERLREVAEEYGFILVVFGLASDPRTVSGT